MKVSQLATGETYESKDGREIRRITSMAVDKSTLYYVVVPIVKNKREAHAASLMPSRTHEATPKVFAEWAARKQGSSTHSSADGKKFLG